jgi:hypothetical protein
LVLGLKLGAMRVLAAPSIPFKIPREQLTSRQSLMEMLAVGISTAKSV